MSEVGAGPRLDVVHLWRTGPMAYAEALDLQRRLVERRVAGGIPDTLLLLEHAPVVTHGKLADPAHRRVEDAVMRDRGIDLVPTDRGGDHTYHGPGQLVGYPIVRLAGAGRDVRAYVRGLESVLMETVHHFGVPSADRADFHAGVWIGRRYLAAIGVRVSRGVASHGFALNIDPRVHRGFSTIVACGVAGHESTSLSEEAGRVVTVEDAAHVVAERFAARFGHGDVSVRDRA